MSLAGGQFDPRCHRYRGVQRNLFRPSASQGCAVTDEPLKLDRFGPGHPKFERAMTVMGKMLAAAAWDQQDDDLDPSEHTQVTMTAAGFLIGYLTGACIVAGALNEGDKARVGKAMLETYRQGINVGRDNAMASMTPEGAA